MHIFTILLSLSSLISSINGAGFEYPSRMPGPHEVVSYNNVLFGVVARSLETPIIIHIAHIGTVGAWNCVAQYDADALDVITNERPIVDSLPDDQHLNSYTRALCLPHAYIKVLNKYYKSAVPIFYTIYKLWGIDDIDPEIDSSVIECNHDVNCLNKLAEENNYYPAFMANIIVNELSIEFDNDGWNLDGMQTSDGECTANCKPYSDTTGYEPQNTDNNKNPDAWVPLLETDMTGFFFRHEHVTPHIGINGKKWLIDEYKKADKPKYDYDVESELLLERLRLLATNDTMKMLTEIFDNKLTVRGMIGMAMLRQYHDKITYENFINYIIGISMTEHDALLQAWNQKVYYDLIRPTTVVQRRGHEIIETYGGPYQGVQKFEAKDFEPYIRVMPHSEYPSGSACLCIGYMEFVHNFVYKEYGDQELENLVWYRSAGSSFVEPDLTPKEDMLIEVQNMEELYSICSESRLWGGMHFTESIHSAKEICSGIGELGYIAAYKLKENSNFKGTIVPDDINDIEEYWLPFLKFLDFLLTFNPFDLITGNIDFDPDILKLLELLIPDIDINAIGTSVNQLFMEMLNLFNSMSDVTRANSVGINNNNNDFEWKGHHTKMNLNHVLIIFSYFIIGLLTLGIGLFIGSKYMVSKTYVSKVYKDENL